MVNKKVKPLSGKDYKRFMGALYNRLKPLLKKSEKEIEETIKALRKQIGETDKKALKLADTLTSLYMSIFVLIVDITTKYTLMMNPSAVDKNTFNKLINKKIIADFNILSVDPNAIKRNSTLSSIEIPKEFIKLASLCTDLSIRLKKLATIVSPIVKEKSLTAISPDAAKEYIANWGVISTVLALQDTLVYIGIKKEDPSKAKGYVKSFVLLTKQLKEYCNKTKKAIENQLKILEKARKDIVKKMSAASNKNTNESYIQEGVLDLPKKLFWFLMKPLIKVAAWMFDQSYYFFKKVQPILLYISNKYTKITSKITESVFKPLYSVNPMFASVAESLLSPVVIPTMIKVSGFFFGGIPAIVSSNILLTMSIVNKMISMLSFDVSVASGIDSAVNALSKFATMFGGLEKDFDSILNNLEEID